MKPASLLKKKYFDPNIQLKNKNKGKSKGKKKILNNETNWVMFALSFMIAAR